MPIARRSFLSSLACLPVFAQTKEQLAPWTPGTMDIHHISTGRGNCTLVIGPDGTTLMIDAGGQMPTEAELPYFVPAYPDLSRRPGEWMARYAKRHMARASRTELDHFMLTHFHSDHMGAYKPYLPKSTKGDYVLSGASDIGEAIPIGHITDRGFPNYNYPTPVTDANTMNYRKFVEAAAKAGTKVDTFQPGSNTQLGAVRKPGEFPTFQVRNIVANGVIWTGQGTATRKQFPELNTLEPKNYPTENMCSAGVRVSYGKFDYYNAGDLSDLAPYGKPEWRNVETAAAKVAGPVDVALASHHGYIDSTGPDVVRALKPRAFVIHAWDSAHPTMPALHNMLSTELYPGPRDIYTTALKPEARIVIKRMSLLRASLGHVIVRVGPGGEKWEVVITSNADEQDLVTARFGPFESA